ncbi:glycosyltransferase family 4 protein [Ligilactobacillus saerimneri]
MKKILILTNTDIELYNFRREIIQALTKRYQVYACYPPLGDNTRKLQALGVTCIDCPYLVRRGINPWQDIRLYRFYRRLFRQIQPDKVLTYTIKPAIYGGRAAYQAHIPFIVNITGLGSALQRKGWLQQVVVHLYRLSLPHAQKVFFQNTANRDFMRAHHLVTDNYDVLPGSGVNLARYPYCPFPSGNKVRFIFVARIMRTKGIDQFLEAARFITARYPTTEFHVYGWCEDSAYEELLAKLTEQGIIKYHGQVDDMATAYRDSTCLIHPSFYPEGMSNVLLEASATGRPVITTDLPGRREAVIAGQSGYLVKPQDIADLIAKIEQFLHLSHSARALMGKAAYRHVTTHFDRRTVVAKYLAEVKR